MGDINLSVQNFRIALYSSAASGSINTATLTIQGEVGTEVSGGRYVAGGQALVNTWTTSGANVKWDCSNPIWTASGSAMSNVRFGVIVKSIAAASGYLMCWSALSTAQFDVTLGNTLTAHMAATGVFTLA